MVHRFVACYDNATDEHLFDVALRDQSSGWICQLFDLPAGHPAYDCYPINKSMVSDVLSRTERPIHFDFTSRSYMIECHDTDA